MNPLSGRYSKINNENDTKKKNSKLKITKIQFKTAAIYTATVIITCTVLGKLSITNVIGSVICCYGVSWVYKKIFKK